VNPARFFQRLSARERRTVTLAVIVVVTAVGALRVLPAISRWAGSAAQRRDAAQETLGRARAVIAEREATRESLSVHAARLVSVAPRVFGGSTPAEAGAQLASLVGGFADQRRVRIGRQDVQTDSGSGLFTRLTLRVEAESDITGLTSWLAQLEQNDKLLSIRSLAVEAPEPAAPAAQPERLRAVVTIGAWATITDTTRAR